MTAADRSPTPGVERVDSPPEGDGVGRVHIVSATPEPTTYRLSCSSCGVLGRGFKGSQVDRAEALHMAEAHP